MKPFLICLLAGCLANPAFAMTTSITEIECPVDGEKFVFYGQGSGTSFGRMLDGMPYGAIAAPWPIPKCPGNGMVIYKRFSEEEIATLKPFIRSEEYQSLQKNETNYWLAYILSKRLSAPLTEQISLMQQATWEAEADQYERYARETIKAIDSMKNPSYELVFLKGELYRRIKEFDKAMQIFSELKKAVESDLQFENTPFFIQIISKELELISEKDSFSHPTESESWDE